MHRIDSPGSVDGQFADGKPGQGVRGTNLAAVWFNDLQENILTVLDEGGIEPTKKRARDLADAIVAIAEAAGGGGGGVPAERTIAAAGLATGGGSLAADRTITVTAATTAQTKAGASTSTAVTPGSLLDALDVGVEVSNLVQAIQAIATGDGSNGVPTTRQIEAAGLATGGGSLAADRTITVAAATGADALAGTSTSKAVTPASLAAAVAGTYDDAHFRNGLIVKAGTVAITPGSNLVSMDLDFDDPFPNGAIAISGNASDTASATWGPIVVMFRNLSASTCKVVCDTAAPTENIDPGRYVRWIAIGH